VLIAIFLKKCENVIWTTGIAGEDASLSQTNMTEKISSLKKLKIIKI